MAEFILFLFFAGFAVAILVGILRVLFSPIWSSKPSNAKNILKERYARGEISEQEYKEMLANIE